jgi:hypothetical protein
MAKCFGVFIYASIGHADIADIKTPKHVAKLLLIFSLYVKNKRLAVCD